MPFPLPRWAAVCICVFSHWDRVRTRALSTGSICWPCCVVVRARIYTWASSLCSTSSWERYLQTSLWTLCLRTTTSPHLTGELASMKPHHYWCLYYRISSPVLEDKTDRTVNWLKAAGGHPITSDHRTQSVIFYSFPDNSTCWICYTRPAFVTVWLVSNLLSISLLSVRTSSSLPVGLGWTAPFRRGQRSSRPTWPLK